MGAAERSRLLVMNKKDEIEDRLYRVGPGQGMHLAEIDILKAIYSAHKIAGQAWLDIAQRYRRSFLGPIWMVLGTVSLATGFSLLGQFIFKIDLQFFLLYVLSGILVWQMINACLSEAAVVYNNDSATLLSGRPSISGYALRVVIRQLIIFFHVLPVLLVISWYSDRLSLDTLLFIPALLLLSLALLPWILIIGLWATRMRDFGQLINVSMQFIVYVTPVFWIEKAIPEGNQVRLLIDLNPFYHCVTLLRDPFLGLAPSKDHWMAVAGIMIAGWILAAFVFPSLRKRVVFWL